MPRLPTPGGRRRLMCVGWGTPADRVVRHDTAARPTPNLSETSLESIVVRRFCFFFFQAEDGIRDYKVTGVQTCALPIFGANPRREAPVLSPTFRLPLRQRLRMRALSTGASRRGLAPMIINPSACSMPEIGRASCRERV